MKPKTRRLFVYIALLGTGVLIGWLLVPPPVSYFVSTSARPVSSYVLSALFDSKRPWDFPELDATPVLTLVAEQCIREYRTAEPHLKLRQSHIYHDADRKLAFLTFEVAEDSPVFVTDFYLVYVYDLTSHQILGYTQINMA